LQVLQRSDLLLSVTAESAEDTEKKQKDSMCSAVSAVSPGHVARNAELLYNFQATRKEDNMPKKPGY
jgi:uncharacterized protein YsxB (DUF464 family)